MKQTYGISIDVGNYEHFTNFLKENSNIIADILAECKLNTIKYLKGSSNLNENIKLIEGKINKDKLSSSTLILLYNKDNSSKESQVKQFYELFIKKMFKISKDREEFALFSGIVLFSDENISREELYYLSLSKSSSDMDISEELDSSSFHSIPKTKSKSKKTTTQSKKTNNEEYSKLQKCEEAKTYLKADLNDCINSKSKIIDEKDKLLLKIDELKEELNKYKSHNKNKRTSDSYGRKQKFKTGTSTSNRRRKEQEEADRRKKEQEEADRRRKEQEEADKKNEEPRKKEEEEKFFEGVPSACSTLKTIYNDYISQKQKLLKLINENKSSSIVEKILSATIKRLDGIRGISLRGDVGVRGCDAFPEWYEKNKSWFKNEFENIKKLVNTYNKDKPSASKIILPLDAGKPFNFSGGKKQIRNTKRKIITKFERKKTRRHH